MDDIIILIETKRQYIKARRRLFAVLRKLRLSISPHKTRMGTLKKGFHFLGVNFEVSQNPQRETQDVAVNVHPRTSRRALDKVVAMKNNAVHPTHIQRYLVHWASWWQNVTGLQFYYLILRRVMVQKDGRHSFG
jgi:hypothetical protein